jgi:hypothetical protein
MYRIDRVPYGFKLTFGGFMTKEEMGKWVSDSKNALTGKSGSFGVFVDMRTLKPLPQDAQPVMQEGQKLYKQAGLQRSVVVLNDAITTMQFKRIAKETGIYNWERYVDASVTKDFEKVAIDWVTNGIDPDKS